MNYRPESYTGDPAGLIVYLQRELQKVSAALQDNSERVFYRTQPVQCGSLSAGISANWRAPAGNVLLVSTSITHTLTGLQRLSQANGAGLERVFINVGTGVLVLKSQAAESSASNRFALALDWNISAGGAGVVWRDVFAARWRGISRT